LLSYGTTDDPLDSQGQLLAFVRRKVEDESFPSSFSDAQPLAPLAAGGAFAPIAQASPGGEAGASLLPAVQDCPAQSAEPPLFVRVSDATATEGEALVFTVSLSAPAAETVQVAYLVADGTATAESGDYQKLCGQVSFAPGQTTQTISVPTADDDCQEGDEHFWLVLHKPRGARIADRGGTGVIIDNDSLPKIYISNAQVEAGQTATFFVSLSNPYREAVSVQYATVADTAPAMDQFEPVWGTLSFRPGEVAARVAVPTLPAAKNSTGGSFSVVLSDPQNAQLDKSAGTASFTDKPQRSQFPAARPTGLETSQGQAALGDGGQMGALSVQTPTLSVYLPDFSSQVTEGQSAIVVFELSHSVDYDVAIGFETAPGTADPTDYYHSEGTVVIPAGSSIEWLWLSTAHDELDEDDEHFWLLIKDGGYFSAPSSLCIPIIDDDAEPVVSIYDDAVNEGSNYGYSPTASLLVALSAPSGKDVLVDWRTWPGTADQYDFSGGSGQLHFLPQWDPWLWVEIPVSNDPYYEPEPEQFFVELWAFQNCSPGDPWAVCTIYDDDLPPEVNISEDQQCSEPQGGSLTLTFTVWLSQPSQEEVTVTWQTQQAWWSSRALATADEDYRSASGTVVFAPYETTPKTIEVTILDDCYAEDDEDFAVYLSGTTGGNASTGRSAALVTIIDNDEYVEPEITFEEYQLNANNLEANLFAPDTEPYPLPLVDLTVVVEGLGPGGATPTGNVIVTAIDSGAQRTPLGVASVGPGGRATIYAVDSGLLGRPGVVVEVEYSGDQFFAAKKTTDGGKTSNDLQADPAVRDNPTIPPDAQNLTVVVVAGSGAERTMWRDSARRYYGNAAYIITDVHSVADLGARLAQLPPGSVSRLVIGAHGWVSGPCLGDEYFNHRRVDDNPVARDQIRAALGNNALIDNQCCGAAATEEGRRNMRALANLLNARVRGADRNIRQWNDSSATWITVNPNNPE